MDIIAKALLALSCGLMDRLRGGIVDVFYGKIVESFIYGLMVAVLLDLELVSGVLFAVLWAVGASFGWGEPIGALISNREMKPEHCEWWQFGKLKTSPMFACIFRGLMWGVAVLPIAYFDTKVIGLALMMGIIFPAAVKLATKPFKIVNVEPWALQEYYRGWLVGLTALILGIV